MEQRSFLHKYSCFNKISHSVFLNKVIPKEMVKWFLSSNRADFPSAALVQCGFEPVLVQPELSKLSS